MAPIFLTGGEREEGIRQVDILVLTQMSLKAF